jgi:hypothetical protein
MAPQYSLRMALLQVNGVMYFDRRELLLSCSARARVGETTAPSGMSKWKVTHHMAANSRNGQSVSGFVNRNMLHGKQKLFVSESN